jgi:Ni/Fe-hydrogenase 1 B-type cytochrome subunit
MSVPANPQVAKVNKVEERKDFYVWQLPIRIFHWVNVTAGLILILTGLYITYPFLGAASEHADGFLMGGIRITHFITASIFILNLIFRLYWFFAGNKYARSNPFTASFWKGVWKYIKYYLFIPVKNGEHVEHNQLAQLTYWVFFGLGSILMVITGLYLFFEPQLNSAVGSLFAWVPVVFGGTAFAVRGLHHITVWILVLFTLIHLYMSIRDTWLNNNGTIWSIFTGKKKVSKDFTGE